MSVENKIKAVLAVVATMAFLVIPATAEASHYSYVYNQRGDSSPLRTAPGARVSAWLANGTRFVMICWLDTSWSSTGNYASRRWFYGQSWSKDYGYIHSSYVYYQKAVRRC
mgnify:CR=1 FL=1